MTIFSTIGTTYNNTRAADERIVAALASLLDLPADAVIADIGAGSGNYTRALAARGFRLKAVEPAEAMRRNALPSARIEWFPGVAEQLRRVRELAGDMTFLVPGVGHQGADVEQVVLNGQNGSGRGLVISSSRGVIYAGSDNNFQQAAAAEAKRIKEDINVFRNRKSNCLQSKSSGVTP